MPRFYDHLGRGATFRIKTREEVLSLWLSGYTEEEISKEKSRGQSKMSVKDVKDIIAFQQTQFGDDFKKLRKWRQKEFIEKAWKAIHVAQDVLLDGLKVTDKKGNFKTTPSMASNIIVAMKDKLKEVEGKEEPPQSCIEKENESPEEQKDLKDAMERIEKKNETKDDNDLIFVKDLISETSLQKLHEKQTKL